MFARLPTETDFVCGIEATLSERGLCIYLSVRACQIICGIGQYIFFFFFYFYSFNKILITVDYIHSASIQYIHA